MLFRLNENIIFDTPEEKAIAEEYIEKLNTTAEDVFNQVASQLIDHLLYGTPLVVKDPNASTKTL
jgi:hypothetical protein